METFSAQSSYISDWFFALRISSCGMGMRDEMIRVAVGLRFELNFC